MAALGGAGRGAAVVEWLFLVGTGMPDPDRVRGRGHGTCLRRIAQHNRRIDRSQVRFGRDRSPLIFEYVDPKVEPPLWCLSSPRPTAVAVKRRPQSVCSGRAARFSATETLTDLFLLNLGCVMPDQYGEQLCTPHAGRLGIVFDQTLHQGAVVCSDQSWSQRRSVGDHEPELVE